MMSEKSHEGYLTRFTLTIRAGTLAVILAIIFTAFFLYRPEDRDTLKFIAGIIAAAAAVTSAFYIGQNLNRRITSEKHNRTVSYAARWNDPLFFPAIATYRGIMIELGRKIDQDPSKDRLALINELIGDSSDREGNLIGVLNFFEEIAIMINRGVVDGEILEEIYHTLVVRSYSSLEPWIKELRYQRGERLFGDLEKLYERWAHS